MFTQRWDTHVHFSVKTTGKAAVVMSRMPETHLVVVFASAPLNPGVLMPLVTERQLAHVSNFARGGATRVTD